MVYNPVRYLGYFLLCLAETHYWMAGVASGLGCAVFDSCSMDRAGDLAGSGVGGDDYNRIFNHKTVFQGTAFQADSIFMDTGKCRDMHGPVFFYARSRCDASSPAAAAIFVLAFDFRPDIICLGVSASFLQNQDIQTFLKFIRAFLACQLN